MAKMNSTPRYDTYGLRAWSGKVSPMGQAHRHHELELNYVLSGAMTYLIGGRIVTLPARRLCALWGAVPHQLVGEATPAEAIWVTAPLPQALAWELPQPLVRRLLREGLAIDEKEQPADLTLLRQWIADLSSDDEAPRRATLLEIEARLRRLALRLKPTRRAPLPVRRPSAGEIPEAVERLARFVAVHYRQTISMADAARAAHLHPHYAMTLFRRHTGLTLHQYITLQRVAHAQRLLATTRQPILDIGLESGFSSVSRFYKSFKAETGSSPRRFRLRLGAVARPSDPQGA
jgi:AraC-like DNA-binding protein